MRVTLTKDGNEITVSKLDVEGLVALGWQVVNQPKKAVRKKRASKKSAGQ